MPDHPIQPGQPDPSEEPEGRPSLPPELEAMISSLTGGQGLDPETARMLQGMGIDKVDPAMLQMMTAQVQAMFSAPAD